MKHDSENKPSACEDYDDASRSEVGYDNGDGNDDGDGVDDE